MNKDYNIPFEGLKIGEHHFSFELDQAFFASFEGSEIERADLKVEVNLEKKETLLKFESQLSGHVMLLCDRCGSEVSLPIDTAFELVVKFGETTEEQDTDVLVIGHSEHDLDLGKYLFEYAHVSLPLKRVHEDEQDCNQEALDALDEYSFLPEDDETDPRWDVLKKLKKD